MAISHITKTYGVQDAKIAKLTADPSGGSATYATAIDVPGVKSITLSGNVANKELRGDNGLLDSDSTLTNVTGTINYAKADLDIMAALLGATVTDSGSGSTEVAKMAMARGDELGNFKIEAVAAKSDQVAGDVHLVLYKCVITGFPFTGFAEEDYATQSLPFATMPRLADDKWIDVVINETAAAIS